MIVKVGGALAIDCRAVPAPGCSAKTAPATWCIDSSGIAQFHKEAFEMSPQNKTT